MIKNMKMEKTFTPDQIYAWSDANKTTPKTSAPALADAMELFSPLCRGWKGNCLLFYFSRYVHFWKCDAALLLKNWGLSDRIKVIDSANLSTGIGLLVVEAAIMAKNNRTASQIVSEIEKLKPNVRASFVVDTLTYLYRGGRCNAVAAMAGGVLKLHPRIVVEDGAMNASKKYRGKIASVVMNYVKDMEKDLKNARQERVFITHSGCDREIVETVRTYLKNLGIFEEILETRAGGVVSSHCGPGTLGVLYISK